MKLKNLVLLGAALFGTTAAVWADVNVGVTVSSTGPAASLGIPERNTIALLPKTIGGQKINWYAEYKYWPFILVLVNLWKVIGYNCIVYMSTIIGFDRGYYEAAAIDGAGKWQQIMKITLPLLKPTIIMMTLLSIGRIFYSDFGLFYQVPQNSGALFSVTNTIDTYVYRGLLELGDITLSAAAGLYQSVIGFILVLGTNLWVRRLDPESALF